MSREVLDESLSAVMDGAADELELRRVLAAAGEDPALRQRWARYQLARDAMHGQSVLPQLDLAAAVSAAIDAEEVRPVAPQTSSRGWRQAVRLAVAASVTLAVLVGVRFYNGEGEAGVATQLAERSAPAGPAQPMPPALAAPQTAATLVSFPAGAAQVGAAPSEPAPADDLIRSVPPQSAAESADGGR